MLVIVCKSALIGQPSYNYNFYLVDLTANIKSVSDKGTVKLTYFEEQLNYNTQLYVLCLHVLIFTVLRV